MPTSTLISRCENCPTCYCVTQWALLLPLHHDINTEDVTKLRTRSIPNMKKISEDEGPGHTNAFLKVSVFLSTKTKQNTFAHTSVFVLFSPVHTNKFSFENAYYLMRFRLSSTLKRPKTLMETTVYDAFFVTVFKRLRFPLSTLETERLQNDAFSKRSTFETVFESLRFHQRFRAFSCGR